MSTAHEAIAYLVNVLGVSEDTAKTYLPTDETVSDVDRHIAAEKIIAALPYSERHVTCASDGFGQSPSFS